MVYFPGQLQIVLPVLGVNTIRVRPAPPVARASHPAESPVFTLKNAKSTVHATAQQIDGEFTLLRESQVVAAWHGVGKAESTKRAYAGYRTQHEALLADGSIVNEDGVD